MATFENQAFLRYGTVTIPSNVTSGEIVEEVSIVKQSTTETYSPGDKLTYIITIVNAGTVAANDLTVTDTIGVYTLDTVPIYPLDFVPESVRYYQNGVLQDAPAITPGSELIFTGINVPAGGNVVIVYDAIANEYAQSDVGGKIYNEVTATGDTIEDISDDYTHNVNVEPILQVNKALSPNSVTETGQVTYTFTITNTGNQNSPADLTLRDVFLPILDPITVKYNGQNWTNGTEYNYSTLNGVFETVAGNIAVNAAQITQDETTGIITNVPGKAVITVTGNI